MKTIFSSLFVFVLALSLRAGDIVIYPNGFQTNSKPYYCVYARTIANGWGWAPDTLESGSGYKATYTNALGCSQVQFTGKSGDVGSMPTNYVVVPGNPIIPYSSKYRFAVYFTNLSDIPSNGTNGAGLILHDFLP